MKPEILPILEQQKSGAAMQNFATQFAAAAKTDGLAKAAAARGLNVITTDYLARTESSPEWLTDRPAESRPSPLPEGPPQRLSRPEMDMLYFRSPISSLLTPRNSPSTRSTSSTTTASSSFRSC